MSDNFERRPPTAAEVAHGLGLEVDLLRQRIAELEAEVERLRADAWAAAWGAARDVQNEWLENRAMKMMEANQ